MMDKIQLYVRHLADHSRRDLYAKRTETGGYVPVRDKLTQAALERHVNRGPSVGQYLVSGNTVRAAAFDLDSHNNETPWEEMVRVALTLISEAENLGLATHAFRSGGGLGIHLWFLWEEPQDARSVRTLLRGILACVGLKDGTGGVAKNEVEVFPKQDRIAVGKFGSLIALPGARASALLETTSLEVIDWEAIDFVAESMRISKSVPLVDDEQNLAASVVGLHGDDKEVVDALKHIPADDYYSWFRIQCALKQCFGERGFEIFDMWSSTAPAKYPGPDDLRRRWDGLLPNGSIGLGTIFYLACQNGWNGPSNSMVREMNARFGILTLGNATQIIVKNGDRLPEDDFVTLSKNAFIDRLAPEMITYKGEDGNAKKQSKAKTWLAHPLAAHYHRIVFDPSLPAGHNGTAWNTWSGFGVTAQAGDWTLLKEHILTNICRSDHTLYEWMLNWMADGIQNRRRVTGTAPVLIGMPGTGKGVLANAYGHLWGSHYLTVTHPEHVTGRFSGHLMGKRFIFIDEGTFGGNRKDAGQLKTRITEPMLVFERKGIDPIRMPNRMNFMVASNEASVVPADVHDRRWMVIDVGNERREDHTYFRAIHKQLNNGGYEAMLHELSERVFADGPDPRKIIKTEALFEQILQAQGTEFEYMHMVLENGHLPQNWLDGAPTSTIRAMQQDLRVRFPSTRFGSEILIRAPTEKSLPRHRYSNQWTLLCVWEGRAVYLRTVHAIRFPSAATSKRFLRKVHRHGGAMESRHH